MKQKQIDDPHVIKLNYTCLVSSFSSMIYRLAYTEDHLGRNAPITVGILIADYRRSFCKENIIDQLERLDCKSGPLIDFYLPGYNQITRRTSVSEENFKLKGKLYSFSRREYNQFIDELEGKGVKVTGRTQLLLVPYENRRLYFREAMNFDLEKDESSGKIESTKLFFDFIIEISRKTTEFNVFKKKIKQRRSKCVFLEFIKEELPSAFLSWLTSPFTK